MHYFVDHKGNAIKELCLTNTLLEVVIFWYFFMNV